MEYKMCPHCGEQKFGAEIIRACVVKVTTDAKNSYEILGEATDKSSIKIIKCMKCKNTIEEKDLVTGIKCNKCGQIVTPNEVNKDGVCSVCEIVSNRPDLNVSDREMIKIILELEQKVSSLESKIENKITNSEKIMESLETKIITEESEEITEEPKKEKKKVQRKPRRKKDTKDTTEEVEQNTTNELQESNELTENTNESNESEINIQSDIENIDNQQEAVFPVIENNSVIDLFDEQPIGSNTEITNDSPF